MLCLLLVTLPPSGQKKIYHGRFKDYILLHIALVIDTCTAGFFLLFWLQGAWNYVLSRKSVSVIEL